MSKSTLGVLLLFALASGCTDGAAPTPAAPARVEVTLFAAASLGEPLRALAARFEASRPDVKVLLSLGSSSALGRQIEEGARCDLFIPAADGPMARVLEARLLDASSRRVVARNQLVVIVPRGGRAPADLAALASFDRVAVGQKGVPVGDYAREALAKSKVEPALAGYPDEPSVVTAVAEGGAPAGIVYGSSLVAHARRAQVERAFAIDASLHSPIVYPAALRADAPAARALLDFLAGEAGRAELERAGFVTGSPP